MSEIDTLKFDVIKADLHGNNTIEASAGTGKTYSLAILVVRLVLEKKLPIEKILLVTFTDAAAAELKERTAKFIRLALQETAKKGSSKEENIEKIVGKCELDNAKKQSLLRQALLDMDKATMATIHSFCQQTLTEFAFETNQEFGKELMSDIDGIVEEMVNDYLRSAKYQDKYVFFKEIGIASKSKFLKAIKQKIEGLELYRLIEAHNREALEFLQEELRKEVENKFEQNLASFKERLKNTGKTGGSKYLDDANSLYNYLSKKKQDIKFNFNELFTEEIARVKQNKREVKNIKNYVAHYHLNEAAKLIIPKVKQKLNEKNALTFNDLIQSLYNVRENPDLIKLMREKYKAVFVDEFQDTDPKQYGIFKTFFQDSDETVLFFIGDPKQSIYGWRQADVETYRSARDSSNMKKLKMNKNFRSSAPFIAAANEFFQLDPDSKLEYVEVEAKDNKTDSGLFAQDEPIPAIQILKIDAGQDADGFTQEVMNFLFSNKVILKQNKNNIVTSKNVSPTNVAVLVRTGYQGKEVKRVLDKLNIPSVLIADENVFASQEAKELKIIFKAILNINSGNIKHALITRLIGKEIKDLHQVNEDVVLPFFHQCRSLWEKDGVSKMMENLFQFFRIIEKNRKDSIGGHQVLANTRQIISILQQQTLQQALTPSEVQAFLNDQINNPDKNNDAYQQTIENDEKAVKIMTIHKAKGLEFDVVVLPYLDLKADISSNWDFISFRKEENGKGKYYFAQQSTTGEPQKLYKQQVKEENERLLYVALTRAKYNAFIFGNTGENHLLKPYIENGESQGLVKNLSKFKEMHPKVKLKDRFANSGTQNNQELGEVSLPDSNYHKLSYSFLAAKHAYHPKEESETFDENSYDHFIFKELPKGAHIGNVLHDMFEFSDFTTNENWSFSIEKALRKFYPSALQEERNKEKYLNQLQHLMQLVVETPFTINGEEIKLATIPNEKRINELEFNFPITKAFQPTELGKVIDDEQREINTSKSAVKGMMNGFVDLFFEHNGKYYILDWKSNFLGDQLKNYASENLVEAMNESNYHLQYLLYTVAVDKFLRSRLGNDYNFETHFGGVVYVFLRGVRPEKKHGFFVQQVKKKELDQLQEVLLGGVSK